MQYIKHLKEWDWKKEIYQSLVVGVGNFMGMLPERLKQCKVYGIEIDETSGGIARQLYQKNTIAINGYQDVELPDSFF